MQEIDQVVSIEELKALYKEFTCAFPKGKMSKKEYMKINCQNKAAEEFVSIMFDAFDTDRNGYICFQEYAVVIGTKKKGSLEQKVELAFNMFDIDGNGSIEYREMLRLISALFKMIASKTHGDNPKVMKTMESQAKERVDQIFKRMDSNNDQKLSFEEFQRGCMADQEISKALLNLHSM